MRNKNKKTYSSLIEKRQEDSHYRVMQILQSQPDITQRELSNQLGISLGKLNYCIKALIKKGWIKVENFTYSKNKSKYIYLLTPKGILNKAQMTKSFLHRKMNEYESLKKEINSLKEELLNSEESI